MQFFPILIKRFLNQVGADNSQRIQMVPKSRSGINPGDIVFFQYGGFFIVVLVISPVFKDAQTGNRLFTGFKVPFASEYTADSLETLYKNKELPQENYRTYIVSKIQSPVFRVK